MKKLFSGFYQNQGPGSIKFVCVCKLVRVLLSLFSSFASSSLLLLLLLFLTSSSILLPSLFSSFFSLLLLFLFLLSSSFSLILFLLLLYILNSSTPSLSNNFHLFRLSLRANYFQYSVTLTSLYPLSWRNEGRFFFLINIKI